MSACIVVHMDNMVLFAIGYIYVNMWGNLDENKYNLQENDDIFFHKLLIELSRMLLVIFKQSKNVYDLILNEFSMYFHFIIIITRVARNISDIFWVTGVSRLDLASWFWKYLLLRTYPICFLHFTGGILFQYIENLWNAKTFSRNPSNPLKTAK